jgi:hypothetical protein
VEEENWEEVLRTTDDVSFRLEAYLSFIPKEPKGVGPAGELVFTENDVRPLGILAHLMRLMQRLHCIPFLRTIAPHLPERFHGWVPGGQMDDPICEVNTWQVLRRMNRLLGLNMFVDQESAFPYAAQEALRILLEGLGFPERARRAIFWLIKPLLHHIRWGRRLYAGPRQRDGLSQGGGLSPPLLLVQEWVCWALVEICKEEDEALVADGELADRPGGQPAGTPDGAQEEEDEEPREAGEDAPMEEEEPTGLLEDEPSSAEEEEPRVEAAPASIASEEPEVEDLGGFT